MKEAYVVVNFQTGLLQPQYGISFAREEILVKTQNHPHLCLGVIPVPEEVPPEQTSVI